MVVSLFRWMHTSRSFLTYSMRDFHYPPYRALQRTHAVRSQVPSDNEMRFNPPPESSKKRPVRLMNRIYLAKQEEKLKSTDNIIASTPTTATIPMNKSPNKEVAKPKENVSRKSSPPVKKQEIKASVSMNSSHGMSKKKFDSNEVREKAEPEKNRPFTLPPGVFR